MKTLKNLILSAAILGAAMFATTTVEAQTTKYFGQLTGGTNNFAAFTTNTLYATVYTTNVISGVSTTIVASVSSSAAATVLASRVITIQPEFIMPLAGNGGASNVVFRIDNSTDQKVWNIGFSNLSVATTGTNTAGPTFTIDTGGALYWRCGLVINTNGAAITNVACPFGNRVGL